MNERGDYIKCPACGANNTEDARFCSLCLTPFRGDEPESPPITSQFSTPPDYPNDIEQPVSKRFGKFSDWFARFGCLIICLGVVATLAAIFLPRVISHFTADIGTDCQRVSDRTFQREVLESSMPVLVIFTNDELWNRKPMTPAFGGYSDPSPVIVALRSIITEGDYKDYVKFYRYDIGSHDSPIHDEYNIEGSTTIIIFKNGDIYWRDKGPNWCHTTDAMIEQSREKLDGILIEVTGEM